MSQALQNNQQPPLRNDNQVSPREEASEKCQKSP